MIKKGQQVRLRPCQRYKDNPEKNVDYTMGENDEGKYVQFQVLDVNATKERVKQMGFFYIQVFTEVPLIIDDMISIKEILYVHRKGNVCIFGCTIEESPIMAIRENKTDVGF